MRAAWARRRRAMRGRASGAPRSRGPAMAVEVEAGGNRAGPRPCAGRRRRLLPGEVGGVARVDLELLRRWPGRCAPSCGQMPARRAKSMPGRPAGRRRERRRPSRLTSRPWRPASVGVRERPRSAARGLGQGCGLGRIGNASCSADAADFRPSRRQALVGVVGAQAQPVLGARGEHAVGLGDAARHQVVDHHADIGVGAARR